MKIKIELDALQNALDIIGKTAPPTSGNMTFEATKGKLKITTVADLSRCQIVVPSEVEGEGEFAVSLQSVKDAVKGRTKLELLFQNSVLHVRSGAYKAELATVDVVPVDVLDPGETKEWAVSTEIATWLKSALRAVALRPTPILSSWMPVGIKVGPKSSFVACYDTQHMSWLSTAEVSGDFEVVLPLEIATSIIDVFHKQPFKLVVSNTSIQVRSKLINVVLSIPTMDDLPTLEQVRGKIKEAMKAKASTFKFAKADVLAFLDNAKAVVTKERVELAVTAGKGLEFLVKSVQGQVKAQIKGVGKGGFKVDLSYLEEVVAKAGPELELNVVDSAFLSIKLEASTAIVALNQD